MYEVCGHATGQEKFITDFREIREHVPVLLRDAERNQTQSLVGASSLEGGRLVEECELPLHGFEINGTVKYLSNGKTLSTLLCHISLAQRYLSYIVFIFAPLVFRGVCAYHRARDPDKSRLPRS